MNKILNWTFGACFRTLGRFLAIFIVFALLLFVGSKLDIELPSWLSLNVKAAEITIPVNYHQTGIFGSNVDLYDHSWFYKDFSSTTDSTKQVFLLPFIPNIDGTNSDYIEFDLMITEPTTTQLTSENIGRYCSKYASIFSGYSQGNIPSFDYTCQSYSQYSTGETIQIFDNNFSLNSMQIYIHYSDNSSAVCTLSNTSKVYCPTNKKLIKDIGINLIFRTSHISYMRILVSRDYNLYIGGNQGIIDSINNQSNQQHQDSQNTQNAINGVNDNINNSNTSGAQDSASGFFNDFSTETFGLTSIITAPLNSINSLINSSCNNLVLPLPFVDKNLTLPCMNIIYSNYFKGFFDLYQIITTGLISYYIIVRIFNLVKDFKNPEHDEIEVMDL